MPHVHTLFVYSRGVIPAAILFSAFPNVQSLDTRMHPEDSHDYPDDDGMHQAHNFNAAELCRLFRPLPSLKYLKAEPIDMYLSSLIWTTEEYHVLEFDQESVPWLLLLLPQIRPSSITFELDVGYVEEFSLSTLENALLEMSNIAVLKKVDIPLRLSGGPAGIVQEVIERLPDLIGLLSIQSLELTIRAGMIDDSDDYSFLQNIFDVEELISEIASKTPTLQCARLKALIGGEASFVTWPQVIS